MSFVRTRVRSDGNLSEPFFDTAVGPHRAQIWHACADSLTLKKKFDPPKGGLGGLGGYLLLKIFRDGPRPNFARMCG